MSPPIAAFRRCQICQTPAACDRARRCFESRELELRNERVVALQADADIPELREHRRIKSTFSGYLLVGGPHDGDFVTFPERGVMRLQAPPRPGFPDRSSQGRIAIEEYVAEYLVGGKRFYRHNSLTLPEAVNAILLWYMPPAAMNRAANALIEHAAGGSPETQHARDCLYVTSDGPAPCTCGAINHLKGVDS